MAEEIRPAASVIAGRDGERGLEVLVLERSPASRFLPGYVAFPGGATDAADAARAERWFGSAREIGRACAVRELLEEVGLAVTSSGVRGAARGSFDVVDSDPPSAEQLRRIARWVAPADVPVRFDAEYFAVAAPDGVEPTPDGSETASAWWVSPVDLLAQWERGERRLYWPTYLTVSRVASCGSAGELLSLWMETREPDDEELERLPASVFRQD